MLSTTLRLIGILSVLVEFVKCDESMAVHLLSSEAASEATFIHNLFHSMDLGDIDLEEENGVNNSTGVCNLDGIQCDSEGRVLILDLSSRNLNGPVSLPMDWRPLEHLQRLSLRNNRLNGRLPTYLPQSLMQFNIDRNEIVGSIPNEWSELKQMERLILSDNGLQGYLPTTLCSMTNLKTLNLSRNRNVHGKLLDCLASLPRLDDIQVMGTQIVGPLPSFLSQLCKSTAGSTSVELGYCAHLGFCLDGYREVVSSATIVARSPPNQCAPCLEPSNVLDSRTCEWIEDDHRTQPPMAAPVQNTNPPTVARLASTGGPTIARTQPPTVGEMASLYPWTSSPYFPHFEPTSVGSVPTAGVSPSYSPDKGGGMPSTAPSSHPHKVNGAQGASQGAPSSDDFYNSAFFLPLFLTLCFCSCLCLCVLLPLMIWSDRRKDRVATFNGNRSFTRYYVDEDDDEEEIVFTKENKYSDLMDILVETGLEPDIQDCEANFGSVGVTFGSVGIERPQQLVSNHKSDTTAFIEPFSANNAGPSRGIVVQPETLAPDPKVRFLLGQSSESETSDVFASWSGQDKRDDPYEEMIVLGNTSSLSSSTPVLNPLDGRAKQNMWGCHVTDTNSNMDNSAFCFRPPQYYFQKTTGEKQERVSKLAHERSVLGIRSPFFDMEDDYDPFVEQIDQKSEWAPWKSTQYSLAW